MCGLPLAPLPLLSMWEMALEEREVRETWERTRWTWETRDEEEESKKEGNIREFQHLPQIVTDHSVGRTRDIEFRENHPRKAVEQTKDSSRFHGYSSIDVIRPMIEKVQREVPIVVETSENEVDYVDDEMEDYYENHKEWPTRSS